MSGLRNLGIVFLAIGMASAAQAAPDSGVEFNGWTSNATVSDGRAFDLDQFTLATWVKLRRLTDSQVFLNRGDASTLFTLYLRQGRVRMLVEYAPGKYAHADVPAPPVDTWVHYLGTYDGQKIRFFVDGKLQATVEAAGRLSPSDAPLHFGCLAPGSRMLDGWLEDVRVWNRALAEEEAARVAQGATGEGLQQGLLARWTKATFDGRRWANEVGPALAGDFQDKVELAVRKEDGYHGIWYANQGQKDEYVFKYSGGLGTYCAKHRPMAVYSKEANKTFFCYGGTDPEQKTLWHMVSYYDHATGMVPRPTFLLDKHTNDAHDNPVIALDDKGYIWIFSSSHGTSRPSFISVSREPYNIDDFQLVLTTNFSYTQPYYFSGQGFLFVHTRYDAGRRLLYAMTSPDGRTWSEPKPYARMELGQYQVSQPHGNALGTAFNFHPAPQGLNWRTNLYYIQTDDFGQSWHTASGERVEVPLTDPNNIALVHDYRSENRNVYMKDLTFDAEGRPVILYLTSGGWEAGPKNDPRIWQTARWTGSEWDIQGTITSDNNYDTGSLYIEEDGLWRIIGPTESGPQQFNPGGEVAIWTSRDQGKSWTKTKQLTHDSAMNHTYCRRPLNAHPDFYAFWADGNAREKSESRLYFTNRDGDHVWRLPVQMTDDFAKPEIAW